MRRFVSSPGTHDMTEVASIDYSQAQRVAQAFQLAPEIAEAELAAGMTEALLLLEREVKDATSTGATGLLRGSIAHKLLGQKQDMLGKVFSPLIYATPVELGTKPHFPPLDALTDWVHSKFDLPRAQAKSVAFLIARKISKKGTKGQHMFRDTLNENASQVFNILDAAVDRIFARVGEI